VCLNLSNLWICILLTQFTKLLTHHCTKASNLKNIGKSKKATIQIQKCKYKAQKMFLKNPVAKILQFKKDDLMIWNHQCKVHYIDKQDKSSRHGRHSSWTRVISNGPFVPLENKILFWSIWYVLKKWKSLGMVHSVWFLSNMAYWWYFGADTRHPSLSQMTGEWNTSFPAQKCPHLAPRPVLSSGPWNSSVFQHIWVR